MKPSATILGAGLMGRLLAWQLARAGWCVQLHDANGPDGMGAAARVAAAMLAPLAESAVAEAPIVHMGQHALQRWPDLLADLSSPVFFQRTGTVVVWHRQDSGEATRLASQWQHKATLLPAQHAPLPLDHAALHALEPSLGERFAQGMHLPQEGQLDNRQLLGALLQELQTLGVQPHWHSPQELSASPPPGSDWLLDCRGLGAKPDWNGLRGVRGEVIRLHAPEVDLTRPTRLLHPRYPLYIAPKPGKVFVVGATEIESEDLSPASVRSTLELLSAAYSVHSGFAEARVLEIATQCRPALPSHLPAIHRPAPRVLQINGLYRHGFLVAPAVLDAVLQLMQDGSDQLAHRWALVPEPTRKRTPA